LFFSVVAAAPCTPHLPTRRSSDLLELYGRYRLLTFDRDPQTRGPTVEVAHEALLREWGRLRAWLEASREDLRVQRRLGQAATEGIGRVHRCTPVTGQPRLTSSACE